MPNIAVIGIKGGWSSELLVEAVARRTGDCRLIEMENVLFDVTTGRAYIENIDLSDYDALIVKKLGARYSPDLLNRLEILRYLEETNQVQVFSSPYGMTRAVDRMSCTLTLRQAGVPLPETVITEDLHIAAEVVERFGKAVLKPLYTSKARGMTLLTAGDHVFDHLEEYRDQGNTVLYIQRRLPDLERDLGICFLGGEYLATYARVSSGASWNTTTRDGGHYEQAHPSADLIELAHKAQAPFGLAFTCVDVAVTSTGPVVFEVSAFGGFRGLVESCNLDAAGLYADYVINKVSNV